MTVKIYPSSVSFAWGELSLTSKNSGCYRYTQLSRGVKNDIDPVYMELGKLHEDNHAASLAEPFEAEVPFKTEIDGAVISGRADFVLDGRIDETKGTFSDFVRKKVIESGVPDTNHLSQLVLYMGQFKRPLGALVYGYYEQNDDGSFVKMSDRTFVVTFRNGVVVVDGKDSDFKTDDLMQDLRNRARFLADNKFAPRPARSASFDGPCQWCPLSGLCEKADFDEITFEEAKEEAKTLIEGQVRKPAKILQTSRKRRITK